MPLPALIPLAVKAAPWVGRAIGTMLPAVVDMFRSGRSPEEAAQVIAPKRQEIVDRFVGSGMEQSAAEAEADAQLAGELERAQLPDPMNPWLSMALSIGGFIGGGKIGKMMGARMNPMPAPPPAAEPMTKALSVPPRTVDTVVDNPFPTNAPRRPMLGNLLAGR